MALTFPEIEELIDSGMALPALNEFIQFAVTLTIGIRTGQMEELPGTQATIIAAMALQKLMDTTDGRKLLGIKASNKVYNEKDYGIKSPQLEIARRLGCGEINRKQALEELRDLFQKAQIYPSRPTLTRILTDLEEEANNLRGNLEVMLRAAGWDSDEGNLEGNLSEILEKLRIKKQP